MLGLGKGSLKLRVKHVKKESKCDGSPLGPATFEIGKNNRACYVENVLLADDPQLQEALGKSKNLLEKSASEETINQVFNKKKHNPPSQLAQFDTLCHPLEENLAESDFLLLPIGTVSQATRFTTAQILVLRGTLGYSENEAADHAAKLGRSLYAQHKESYSCDAKLTIGGQEIVGHRAVFAGYSRVLARLYTSSSSQEVQTLQGNVQSLNVDAKALQKAVLWMYTGNVKLGEQGEQIRQVGDLLNMPYLQKAVDEREFANNHQNLHVNKALIERSSNDSMQAMECDAKTTYRLATQTLNRITRKTSMAQLTRKMEDAIHSADMEKREDAVPQEKIRLHKKAQRFGAAALYAMHQDPGFVNLSPESIYELLSSNCICVKTEVDVYEAAVRWLTHDFSGRRKYLNQLMDCPRWVHMNACDMVRVRNFDHDFFKHVVVAKNIAKAKWYQDLIERGVTWKEYKVPRYRQNPQCGLVMPACT